MAKPGRIGRYQLLRPWQFDEMGIARPHELPKRQRVGALAVKVGMTQEWNEHGARVPLTVLWIDECEVRARPGDRRPATGDDGVPPDVVFLAIGRSLPRR